MASQLLLTSFTTWKPEQVSNASDDLVLAMLEAQLVLPTQVVRLLPVDFEEAPRRAIAYFEALQPETILCLGMAEQRDRLNLERQAIWAEHCLQTALPLEAWLETLSFSQISNDAGQFVCNRLYYALLHHIQQQHPQKQALFVHVPILTDSNQAAILQDIQGIIKRLCNHRSVLL